MSKKIAFFFSSITTILTIQTSEFNGLHQDFIDSAQIKALGRNLDAIKAKKSNTESPSVATMLEKISLEKEFDQKSN